MANPGLAGDPPLVTNSVQIPDSQKNTLGSILSCQILEMEVRTDFIKARQPALVISFPFHPASLAANVEDRLDLNFTGFPCTRQPEIGTWQGAPRSRKKDTKVSLISRLEQWIWKEIGSEKLVRGPETSPKAARTECRASLLTGLMNKATSSAQILTRNLAWRLDS